MQISCQPSDVSDQISDFSVWTVGSKGLVGNPANREVHYFEIYRIGNKAKLVRFFMQLIGFFDH
jgi:hypothetical protein